MSNNNVERTKEIVMAYMLAFGQGPEALAETITDDFNYIMPKTVKEFLNLPSELKGIEGLRIIQSLTEKVYMEGTKPDARVIKFIAEDDLAVMEVELTATRPSGEAYSNNYVFTIQVKGDKVAEVTEYLDTLQNYQTSWHSLKDYPILKL